MAQYFRWSKPSKPEKKLELKFTIEHEACSLSARVWFQLNHIRVRSKSVTLETAHHIRSTTEWQLSHHSRAIGNATSIPPACCCCCCCCYWCSVYTGGMFASVCVCACMVLYILGWLTAVPFDCVIRARAESASLKVVAHLTWTLCRAQRKKREHALAAQRSHTAAYARWSDGIVQRLYGA